MRLCFRKPSTGVRSYLTFGDFSNHFRNRLVDLTEILKLVYPEELILKKIQEFLRISGLFRSIQDYSLKLLKIT
jgi:hypothetical protein